MMWSRTFWIAVAERSIKTVAQTSAALLVGNGVGLLNADWISVLSVAGMAGVVSVLTSIGSATVGNDGPSLAGEDLER
jgi:glyoxylate carboligase